MEHQDNNHKAETTSASTAPAVSGNNEHLGQGSFGRVEKVCWGDRWYARKTMLRESHDEGLSYASLRECDIYSRFTSSFMPSIFRIEVIDHQVCLWMGLAEKSLAQYLSDNPPFAERVKMLGQVLWSGLNFLHYIHAYNVLHRDIKPDNILLQKNENSPCGYNIYVSDMGSCRWFYRGMKLTGGMGTKCYRPPEMNAQQYGKPAEIYGLGVTAIHVLHGLHPVAGKNPLTLPSQWQQTLRAYMPYISAPLYELLRQMIYAKPMDRISVKDALEHDYFQRSAVPPVPRMQGVPFPGDYTPTLCINHDERRAWIEYMIDLGLSYGCGVWTVCHGVHLFDDFLAGINLSILKKHTDHLQHNAMELYACVAIWIVSKYFEEHAIALNDLIHQCQQRFTSEHFIDMEEYMIQMLRFRIVRRPPPKEITSKTGATQLKFLLGASEYLQGEAIPIRQLRARTVTCRQVY